MAGSLVQVDTFTVSSAVGSVILGGGSSGSSSYNFAINTDDVYFVTWNNWMPETDTVVQYMRVTTGGTSQSGGNYTEAYKGLYSDATYSNGEYQDSPQWAWGWGGTGTSESSQGYMYLYNFNKSSEYSSFQSDNVEVNYANQLRGYLSGGVHTVNEANDGIQFLQHTGNIASGTFTMYKVLT